ncbi:hypothetical protein Cfor_00204, partial [Coptotermes formosanus]
IQFGTKKSSKKEEDNEEDADPENLLEVQTDQDLEERAKRAGVGEEHESSDEELEGEDDDATVARSRQRHTENQEYEEPEEEDDGDVYGDKFVDEGIEADENMEGTDEFNDDSNQHGLIKDEYDSDIEHQENEQSGDQLYETRRARVVSSLEFVVDYDYDTEQELWCKIQLAIPLNYKRCDLTDVLQEVAANSVIWEIPSLKRAITYINSDTQVLSLKTEGINFQEMFKYDKLLDLNRLYSNDIHKIADVYGIEAARRVIVKEMQDVFKVYGIIVDPRHLMLVADYMTYSGKYEPFSRKTIGDNASPLQQMSFESSINFLKIAVTR